MWCVIEPDELFHHGIRGQKWGVRRFQNRSGRLTMAGRARMRRKEKRRRQFNDAKPAIAAIAAGTAVVGLSIVAARYGDDISRSLKSLSGQAASAVEKGLVNTGKKAVKGTVTVSKKAARFAAANVELVRHSVDVIGDNMWYVIKDDELYHHGIKGQKWGVRRFQNPDGSWTQAGERRYGKNGTIEKSVTTKDGHKLAKSKKITKNGELVYEHTVTWERDSGRKKPVDKSKLKKALAVGATITAATAVGVLASRSFNKETAVMNDFLKEYGNTMVREQRKLSDNIVALDRESRKSNLSFQEASSRAEKMYRENAKNVSDARDRVRSATESARKYSDKSLDTLAAKSHFNGSLKATDHLSVLADQGKEAVKNFLKAA